MAKSLVVMMGLSVGSFDIVEVFGPEVADGWPGVEV
jgi:hypothetical protein